MRPLCAHGCTDQHDDDNYNCESDDTRGIPGNRDRGRNGCRREFRVIICLEAGCSCRLGGSRAGSIKGMQNSCQESYSNQSNAYDDKRAWDGSRFHVLSKYNRNPPSRAP
jgi:hypothetical protein